MEAYEPFVSLGAALVAGLLIGLEREQSAMASEKPEGSFFGGARTFPLFALLGALAVLVARQLGLWIVIVTSLGVLAFIGIAYAYEVIKGGDRGLTTEGALFLTFLLGALAMTDSVVTPASQKILVVLAVAVVATLLLSVKSPLRRFVAKATQQDVLATSKFLLAAVVVLPLLPNRTYGPLDVLNPYKIGTMIVLIAGVSFVGYVAMRVLGQGRGLGVTGLVGGLASSTAVTLTFSKRAKEEPALAPACALAVVLASTVMSVRVIVLVAITSPALVRDVAFPMGAMAVALFAACAFLYRESKRAATEATDGAKSDVQLSNPFELGTAIKLGALFAVVLFLSKAATMYAGAGGTYLAGLLAGATDVDAITLSMANLATKGLALEVAMTTILIGVAANTLVKGGIALSLGGAALGKRVIGAFALSIACGALGALWVWIS